MRVIAHRSGPTVFPGQTILSAKHALEIGAHMIELDVRFTSDRKIAITHDSELGIYFNCDKKVGEITAQEFLAVRHKANPEYATHLLEDYLKCGVEPILIHIKEDRVIGDMLKLLDEYNYLDKVVMGVQSVESVAQIKAYDPNIKMLAFMPGLDKIEKFAAAGVDYIRLWEGWLTEENISIVRKSGKELWVMTGEVDGYKCGYTSKENIRRIISLGVDGILINDVRFLIDEL